MQRALRDRVDRLEQRSKVGRPGFSPVVHYAIGEPLPELRPHPEGGTYFLIPDNGREARAKGATGPGGNA